MKQYLYRIIIVVAIITSFILCLSFIEKNELCSTDTNTYNVINKNSTLSNCDEYYDENEYELNLYALSACLMDAENGRILYSKNANTLMANASTTKILTAIIAIENCDLDEIVDVSSYAASMPDVQLNIRDGEQYLLKDLLYSLMLESHNDSAVAIAEHVAGSIENFSKLMNEKAASLGCYQSFFITPNGLDNLSINEKITDREHQTTAAELSKIMCYCIKNEIFIDITSSQSHTFTDISGRRSFTVSNKNTYLTSREGTISGKTGFTCKAGYCYVCARVVNNHTYVISLLACGWPNNKTYKWHDADILFNYAKDELVEKEVNLLSQDNYPLICVLNAQTDKLNDIKYARIESDSEYTDSTGQKFNVILQKEQKINMNIDYINYAYAPVLKGDKLACITYNTGIETLYTEYLVNSEDIKERNLIWYIKILFNILI